MIIVRWEYLVDTYVWAGNASLDEILNRAGDECWELVTVEWGADVVQCVFKRPVLAPAQEIIGA